MRIPKKVFSEQFGHEEVAINITNVTDITNATRSQSEVLLGTNKVFTSQPGFQCTSLNKNAALDFAKPPK